MSSSYSMFSSSCLRPYMVSGINKGGGRRYGVRCLRCYACGWRKMEWVPQIGGFGDGGEKETDLQWFSGKKKRPWVIGISRRDGETWLLGNWFE